MLNLIKGKNGRLFNSSFFKKNKNKLILNKSKDQINKISGIKEYAHLRDYTIFLQDYWLK